MDVMQKIFGGGDPDDHQAHYQRYQTGYANNRYDDLDDHDVYERYQRTVQHAPPDVVEEAHIEAFQQLPPDQRMQILRQFQQANNDPRQPFNYNGGFNDDPREMARMARMASQQQPDLLQSVMGPGGALSNPLAKAALAGVAAMAAQRIMGGGPGGGRRGGIFG